MRRRTLNSPSHSTLTRQPFSAALRSNPDAADALLPSAPPEPSTRPDDRLAAWPPAAPMARSGRSKRCLTLRCVAPRDARARLRLSRSRFASCDKESEAASTSISGTALSLQHLAAGWQASGSSARKIRDPGSRAFSTPFIGSKHQNLPLQFLECFRVLFWLRRSPAARLRKRCHSSPLTTPSSFASYWRVALEDYPLDALPLHSSTSAVVFFLWRQIHRTHMPTHFEPALGASRCVRGFRPQLPVHRTLDRSNVHAAASSLGLY